MTFGRRFNSAQVHVKNWMQDLSDSGAGPLDTDTGDEFDPPWMDAPGEYGD